MNRTLDKIIRKKLLFVMTSRGFLFSEDDARANVWSFTKKGERRQEVIVYSPCREVLKFDAGISPSSKYGHIEGWIKWAEQHPAHWDPAFRWWTFRSRTDMEEILDVIVSMLDEFLFDLLDELEKEPEERLFPDAQKEKDLFENHKQYQQKFAKKYGLCEMNEANILQALNNAAALWKKENADCEREILLAAAMYGKLFELKGGVWAESVSKGELFHAEVHIPNKTWGTGFVHQIMPLVDAYRIVQNHQPAEKEYEMILQYTGNQSG